MCLPRESAGPGELKQANFLRFDSRIPGINGPCSQKAKPKRFVAAQQTQAPQTGSRLIAGICAGESTPSF
jgi:hypothetical protein